MTTTRGSRGDATRTMELLWGLAPQPTRGPKQGLTLEAVVGAAVALADAEGIDALSMRRVAEALGVGAMSLYTYVPGKAELVDLMLDRVYGEQRAGIATEGGWRPRLESRARADWALYERHPWVVRAAGPRPTLGPNETAVYEATLAAVDGIGLTGDEMVAVVTLVSGYVGGVARGIVEAVAEDETQEGEEAWWRCPQRRARARRRLRRGPLPRVDAARGRGRVRRPPRRARLPRRRDPPHLRVRPQRVLDGIAVLVDARAAG